MNFDDETLEYFIKNQTRLFPKVLVKTKEDAADLLEELGAAVCTNLDEVKEYLDETMDISGVSKKEILELEEVFKISDKKYLVVEG